jgi:NADP-dependent 3-hydroxy acid dehydrogenase YdfG
VVGAGPGNGAAFARRFAAEGYQVALLARNEARLKSLAEEVPGSLAVPCDVASSASVASAFAHVLAALGPVDTLIYNAGNYVMGGVSETDAACLEQCFRVNAVGCLNAVRQVVEGMRARGRGEIVVIGATASRRGAAGSLPFAAAKAGQRVMVESMARELSPRGIHVSYVVIDAAIDSPLMRKVFPSRTEESFAKADDIAASVAHLVQQPRSAWTFELDLRPYLESW